MTAERPIDRRLHNAEKKAKAIAGGVLVKLLHSFLSQSPPNEGNAARTPKPRVRRRSSS